MITLPGAVHVPVPVTLISVVPVLPTEESLASSAPEMLIPPLAADAVPATSGTTSATSAATKASLKRDISLTSLRGFPPCNGTGQLLDAGVQTKKGRK